MLKFEFKAPQPLPLVGCYVQIVDSSESGNKFQLLCLPYSIPRNIRLDSSCHMVFQCIIPLFYTEYRLRIPICTLHWLNYTVSSYIFLEFYMYMQCVIRISIRYGVAFLDVPCFCVLLKF